MPRPLFHMALFALFLTPQACDDSAQTSACPQPCGQGQVCSNGQCFDICSLDKDCDLGEVCEDGLCQAGVNPGGCSSPEQCIRPPLCHTRNGASCINRECVYVQESLGAGCPLPSEDANSNGIQDNGEVWSGACAANATCVECETDAFCGTEFCECADANCQTKRCSAADCPCQYNATGGATCTGFLNGGVDDVSDTCGAQVCDGSGGCALGVGDPCTTNESCGTGFCVDGVCCSSACTDSCHRCDAPGQQGTCVPSGEGDPCGVCRSCDSLGACVANSTGHEDCGPCSKCDNGSCIAQDLGEDLKDECTAWDCPNTVRGWNGTNCMRYEFITANNGDCNGAGACTDHPQACTGETTIRGCSAGCTKACVAGAHVNSYNEVSEVCHVDFAQHSCGPDHGCSSRGNCEELCSTSDPNCGGNMCCNGDLFGTCSGSPCVCLSTCL